MDYEIINSAISDIIKIVNNYNKEKKYDVVLCEKLVIVLLGYYLVFGPEIFQKINLILETLNIYQCDLKQEYQSVVDKINAEAGDGHKYCLISMFDYKYQDNRFIGAVPNIIFIQKNILSDVLSIAHELSHVLEGVSAKIIIENKEFFCYEHVFEEVKVIKDNNACFRKNHGFKELVTTGVENKIMQSFLKLDKEQIDSIIIKDFLEQIKCYKGKTTLVYSYETLHLVFKDLFDNECFWDLIKKYYYENQPELLEVEFNSYANGLDLKVLINCAEHLLLSNIDEMNYYGNMVKKQVELFSEVTNFKPDKSILILV